MKLIKTVQVSVWLVLFSLGLFNSAYAKTTQAYAIDMANIADQAKKYLKSEGSWPKNFYDLDNKGYLDSLDISQEIKNREYQIYNSKGRFAIGIVTQLVKESDLNIYLPSLSSFAGYNWLFIETDAGIIVPKKKQTETVDYYERQLPFRSNIKQLVKGRVFKP